jgi:hypothetical protein
VRINADLPLFAPLNAVVVVVQTKTDNQLSENTFGYLSTAPGGVTQIGLNQLAQNWAFVLQALYMDCLTVRTTITNILAALVSANDVPTGSFQPFLGIVGTAAGNPLPGEMAAIINRGTTTKGQHGRGRFSMPNVPAGFTSPGLDANILNGAGIVKYNAFMAQLPNVLIGGGLTWLHSLLTRPLLPATIVSRGSVVSSLTLNPLLGTVRRRKEGRGR